MGIYHDISEISYKFGRINLQQSTGWFRQFGIYIYNIIIMYYVYKYVYIYILYMILYIYIHAIFGIIPVEWETRRRISVRWVLHVMLWALALPNVAFCAATVCQHKMSFRANGL